MKQYNIAEAKSHFSKLTMVTADSIFADYGIKLLW